MRLKMKSSVPPIPETIWAGLSDLKSGQITPNPMDRATREKDIRKTVQQHRKRRSGGVLSIILESTVRLSVMRRQIITVSQNFVKTIFLQGKGAIPTSQNLFPSKLKMGKVKRVVKLDKVKPIAPRFTKEIIFFHLGVIRS